MENSNPWTLSNFTILELLGQGKFAKVHKAIEKRSGTIVA